MTSLHATTALDTAWPHCTKVRSPGRLTLVNHAGCDNCKNSTVHHPSSHHSRMGGGTRLPQTSFTPPLWTGNKVALQALDSHPLARVGWNGPR